MLQPLTSKNGGATSLKLLDDACLACGKKGANFGWLFLLVGGGIHDAASRTPDDAPQQQVHFFKKSKFLSGKAQEA